jgi:hypothetical protein
MQPEKEKIVMCHVCVHVLCDKRFSELLSDQTGTELAVEDVMSQVLLFLFGEGMVDEVTVHSSFPSHPGLPNCSISIRAQSPCHCFTVFPRAEENMQLAIENSINVLLRELFIFVNVDQVTLSHAPCSDGEGSLLSPWDYGEGSVLSC